MILVYYLEMTDDPQHTGRSSSHIEKLLNEATTESLIHALARRGTAEEFASVGQRLAVERDRLGLPRLSDTAAHYQEDSMDLFLRAMAEETPPEEIQAARRYLQSESERFASPQVSTTVSQPNDKRLR